MSVKRNVLAGWISHLITVLIGFFLMPFIIRVIGDSQYGAWIFINAFAGYSGVIYSGFGATICRYVADLSTRKEWDKLNGIVSSIQAVYLCTATLIMTLCGIMMLVAPYLSEWEGLSISEVRWAMLLVGLSFSLGMAGSVFGGVLIGIQRLDLKRSIETLSVVLRAVLAVYFLQQQSGLITLGIIFFAITVVDTVLSYILAHRQLPELHVSLKNASWDSLKECSSFTGFNALALVAEYLIFYTDKVVIGIVLGPIAVTVYQIGLRIAEMVRIPVIQIGEAVLPKAGELNASESNDAIGSLVARAMGLGLLFTGAFFIGVTYFGDVFITTWMGESYPQSYQVLAILLGSQVIALPMMISRKALLGMGHVRVPAYIDLLEAALNLVISLILIQFWGILGVAWGTLIPVVGVELFVFLPYAMKELRIGRRHLVSQIVAPQIPALLCLLAFCHLADEYVTKPGWLPVLSVAAVGGVVLIAVRYGTHLLEQRDKQVDPSATPVS